MFKDNVYSNFEHMWLLGALPCGSSPLACHALSKLIYELGSQSLQNSAFHLMRSVPKSACHLFGQWLRRVRHAETDKEEKKENKGHSALWAKAETESLSWPFLHVSSRESKTQKERASAGGAVRKIERNTMRVWESEKEKGDIFIYSSYTQGR